jgi:6-pyruvoyl-tetrahydropterin synthase
LDQFVHECVLREIDHRDLNREVREFENLVPTSENLAVVIKQRLERNWSSRLGPVRLSAVRLHETKRNRFALDVE